MNRRLAFPVALFAAVMPVLRVSAEPVKRAVSAGPLERFDPAAVKLDGLVATHGKPLLGLPGAAGYQMQRIGKDDRWLVESGNFLAMIERDREAGEMRLREVIHAGAEWCLTPDGTKLFATRLLADPFRKVAECFDFASGKSLWTVEDRLEISDAVFTPDGSRLILLHPVAADAEGRTTAVTWLDSATGDVKRQVRLPGEIYMISGSLATDYLAVSGRAVYVAVPRESQMPEGWMIPDDRDEPVRLEWDKTQSDELANLRIGGARRELLAVYTADVVELFREEEAGLTLLHRTEVSGSFDWSSDKNVRFTPDHKRLLIGDCEKSLLLTTLPAERPLVKRFKGGNRLGDFTADGKFFVSVDDGGGLIRELSTLERADRAKLREFPAHCCPIEEAGFSFGGDWIISSDKQNLLLWTKDGEILAELASPNQEGKRRIEMQSPVIVERLRKVYAADGWNFIEWDIGEVEERRRKFPGFQLRVVGKVVFDDRKNAITEPEHMDITFDSTGTKLVTATRRTFVYRSLDEPEKSTELQVSKRDVFMRPREIRLSGEPGSILVKSARELLKLDPEGKDAALVLSTNCTGLAAPAKRIFEANGFGPAFVITARVFGEAGPGADRMEMPASWKSHQCPFLQSTPDGRWVLLVRSGHARLPTLAVIDWERKKVVREVSLPWTATSMDLSTDGLRLLVGSFNRSVYEFDVRSLCQDP